MYLDELERRLMSDGIETNVFVVTNTGFLKKIDEVSTGLIRMVRASSLLHCLSKFDLLHVQFTIPLGFAFTFLDFMIPKKPIVIHTHGYDVFSIPEIGYGVRRKKIGRFLVNYSWKKAKSVIAVCKASKSVIEGCGIPNNRVNLLYNGVDENLFKRMSGIPKRLSELRNNNDFLFLSVASLTPVKNHANILKAFSDVYKKYRSKYRMKLLLIGIKPENSAINIKSDEDIIYLGKVDHNDLPLFYNAADAFLLGSISEAHPWSVLEAMSCERPVIASNVGGIPETLSHSELLFEPRSIEDISRKLEVLINGDKKQRYDIGNQNREQVLRCFTMDIHVDNLKRIYESALR